MDGEPGEERDVDECGDQGRPDEERHHDRAPRRSGAQRAAGDERAGGSALAGREPGERDEGHGHEPRSVRGDRAALRLRRGEGHDHRTEPHRQQQGAPQIGLGGEGGPAAPGDQGAGGGREPRQEQGQQDEGRQGQRRQPAGLAGDRQIGPADLDVLHQPGRCEHHQRQAGQRQRAEDRPGPVEAFRQAHGPVFRQARAAVGDDGGGQDQPDRAVEPEDRPPVADRQHDRAVQRAEDAAELLHRADDAERQTALVRWPQVGDQGQRGRDQAAAADALDQPAGDHRLEVVGRGRDDRADREDQQATPAARGRDRGGPRCVRSAAAPRRTPAGTPTRSAPPAAAPRCPDRPTSSCRAARAPRRTCRRPRRRSRWPPVPAGPARLG